MTRTSLLALAIVVALSACKKPADTAPAGDAAASAPTAPSEPVAAAPAAPETKPEAAPVDDTPEARERAEKQGKLDYATMEDGYLGDAKGQWATSAKASSSFGDADKAPPDSHDGNTPWQATGAPNGDDWNNNSQDIGFDWLELGYDKPVKATEVRVVTVGREAVESINKVELIDADGAAHTVWTGLSDTKQDDRGSRSWFVRRFDATPYAVKSVKLTFANNVSRGYKQVDAVQLVGE